MNISVSSISFRVTVILMALMVVLTSGCSDSANSGKNERVTSCTAGDVLPSVTPPALEAVCSIPPGPISSTIETVRSQQQSVTEQRRAELLDSRPGQAA
jgi:hypothetical protein